MGDLTTKQKQLIRDAAPSIAAKERELALLIMQREEIQKALTELLRWKDVPYGTN